MTTANIESAYSGLPAVASIPTNIMNPGVLSNTSSAPECFANQRFSNKLQAYLVSYVNSIASTHPIFEG